MTVQLGILAIGTIFTVHGKKYKKTSIFQNDKFCCHPILGEQIQTNIDMWFDEKLLVNVN